MYGIIKSLNLGTSSGIVLYEVIKQGREFKNRKKKLFNNIIIFILKNWKSGNFAEQILCFFKSFFSFLLI